MGIFGMYFSATGTTKEVVLRLCEILSEGRDYSTVCFNLPKDREKDVTFNSEDIVVFGIPVYAGRIPNLLLPFIRDKVLGNGALAIPVVLYGNRNYDDALIELRNVLEENGFHTIAGGAFIGEHSFSTILGGGRPDEKDMEIVSQFGERILGLIKTKTYNTPVKVKGNDPVAPYYTPRDRQGNPVSILKVKPKTNDTCVKCGKCARNCPMGAISFENFIDIPGICIKCCACVKGCPKGSKYFDDPKFIYHKEELELGYSRRAEPELFY